MADDLKIRVPVELDFNKSLSDLKLNTPKVQAKIQSELNIISKSLRLNIQSVNIGGLNSVLTNIQNQVVGANNELVLKPTIDGKAIEDTDVLIKTIVSKLQSLNSIDLKTFKNNLKNLGFSGKDVTSSANKLVQALKPTPENENVIINSYQNLMDCIRNTIKNDSLIKDANFDNNIAMSIFNSLTATENEYKKFGNTAVSAISKINPAVETVVNTNEQMTQSVESINTKYRDSFDVVSDVIQQAKSEFKKFGEVSVVSNKETLLTDAPEHFKDFTIQVKSATGEVQKFKYEFNSFDNNGETNFRYLLTNINEADIGVKKLANDIAKVKSDYMSKLTGFESTNSQIKSGLSTEIANVKSEIDKLGTDNGSIRNLRTAFSNLEVSTNRIKENLKATASSLNPIDNAINRYRDMDNTIKDISNKFKALKFAPDNINSQIDGLKTKLLELQNIENNEGTSFNWSVKYRELSKAVKEASVNVKNLQLAEKADDSSVRQQIASFNQIKAAYHEISKLKSKINSETNQSTINIYKKQVGDQYKLINQNKQFLNDNKLLTQEIQSQCDIFQEQLRLETKIAQNKANDKRIQEIKSYKTLVDGLIIQLDKMTNNSVFVKNSTNSDVKEQIADLSKLRTQLVSIQSSLNQKNINSKNFNNIKSTVDKLKNSCAKAKVSVDDLKSSISKNNAMSKETQQASLLSERINKLNADIMVFKNTYVKAMKSNTLTSTGRTFSQEIENMQSELANCANSGDCQRIAVNLRRIKSEAKSLGLEGTTIIDDLFGKLKKFSSWMGMTSVVTEGWAEAKKMVTNVIDIDSAMTDLKKVTSGTASTYEKFLEKSINKSKDLKKNVSDLIEQSAEWSKQGYDLNESSNLAQSSAIYSVVGEVDNATAVQDLTTAIKGFNLTVEDSMSIVDRYNAVSNQYAATAGEIGDMVSRSASSLRVAGNTLDQTIAMGVAIKEITGDAAEAGE